MYKCCPMCPWSGHGEGRWYGGVARGKVVEKVGNFEKSSTFTHSRRNKVARCEAILEFLAALERYWGGQESWFGQFLSRLTKTGFSRGTSFEVKIFVTNRIITDLGMDRSESYDNGRCIQGGAWCPASFRSIGVGHREHDQFPFQNFHTFSLFHITLQDQNLFHQKNMFFSTKQPLGIQWHNLFSISLPYETFSFSIFIQHLSFR